MSSGRFQAACVLGFFLCGVANAGIIPSGKITGNNLSNAPARMDYAATGSDTRTIDNTDNNGGVTQHTAHVTTGGIQLRLNDVDGRGASYGIGAGLTDTYMVTGGTPGEELTFNAYFTIDGRAVTLPSVLNPSFPYFGAVNIAAIVGADSGSDPFSVGAKAGNPAIDNQFGQVGMGITPFSITTQFKDVTFSEELIAPLKITVGEQFDLAFSVTIQGTGSVDVNMLNTASVSFDLPDGYAISSVKGFGTTDDVGAVPEPSSLALLGLGSLSFGGYRWRRKRNIELAA